MVSDIAARRRQAQIDRTNIRKYARSFHQFNNMPTMWQTDGNGDLIRVVKYKPTTTRYATTR